MASTCATKMLILLWLSCSILSQGAAAADEFKPTLRRVLQSQPPIEEEEDNNSFSFSPFLVSPAFLFAAFLFAFTILRYIVSSEYRGRVWNTLGKPTRGLCSIVYFHGTPPPPGSGVAAMIGRRFGRQRRTSSIAREYGVDAMAVALPPNTIELSPIALPQASLTQSNSNLLEMTPIARASFVDIESSAVEPEAEATPVALAEADPVVAEVTSVDSDESPVAQARMVEMDVTQPRARALSL